MPSLYDFLDTIKSHITRSTLGHGSICFVGLEIAY